MFLALACALPEPDIHVIGHGKVVQAWPVPCEAYWRFHDGDEDGYGAEGSGAWTCDPTEGVENDRDCDDLNSAIHPGAPEWCFGDDTNCDGVPGGDDAVDAVDWGYDEDGDGYAGAAEGHSCATPAEATTTLGDCDDTEEGAHPGATDLCGDRVDMDCDGADTPCGPDGVGIVGGWYTDVAWMPGVGDIDGDGNDDIVIADSIASMDGGGSGGVAAYFGPLVGMRFVREPDATWNHWTCSACGTALVVDDLDGDGRASIVVGDSIHGHDVDGDGAVMLLADPLTEDLGTPALLIASTEAHELLGLYVESGPDLDGDGARDIYTYSGGDQGKVLGFSSASRGTVASDEAAIGLTGEGPLDGFGTAFDSADIDGDGVDDLVAASTSLGDGRVYRFEGPLPARGSAADASAYVDGTQSGFGDTVSCAGDLDGDGYADVLVAAPAEGRVTLLPGAGWPALDIDAPWTATRHAAPYRLGSRILPIEDGQVAIWESVADAAAIWVFAGPWVGSQTAADAIAGYTGTDGELNGGMAVGDVDGDGARDLVAVQGEYAGGGAAWVLPGEGW